MSAVEDRRVSTNPRERLDWADVQFIKLQRISCLQEHTLVSGRRGRVCGRWQRGLALVALGLTCGLYAASAQQDDSETPGAVNVLESLRQGPLVIWVVGLAALKIPKVQGAQVYRAPDPGYHESTTGALGQTAGSYGQTAGSYGVDASSPTISAPSSPNIPRPDPSANTAPGSGYTEQTSGSFGQTSSSYGTTASSHGQTASSLGQTSSSYGQTSGSYGQTAGSYGQSASSFGESATATDADKAKTSPRVASASPLLQELRSQIADALPELAVSFQDVPVDALAQSLRAVVGTDNYPDVLIGNLPQEGFPNGLVMGSLTPARFMDDGVTDGQTFEHQFVVLSGAPHARTAMAFSLWMGEPYEECPGCVEAGLGPDEKASASVAVVAIQRLMQGSGVGEDADPLMAPFPPNLGRSILTSGGNRVLSDDLAHVELMRVSTVGKLAAVSLRVMVGSAGVFGVAHPLVVLRKGDDGKWRVLHASLNLPAVESQTQREALVDKCTDTLCGADAGALVGVSLASPRDGEQRQSAPELWWDNGGGSRLEVVEWQGNTGGGWSDARLFLVPDRGAKLRTRVTAQFASREATYRWRVWSVGADGVTKISAWRTFKIVK